MSWVGQRSWQGIGGCAYVEGVLHNVVELQNTPLHAHDLGSGRGESDPVIPRGHDIKGSSRWHTVPHREILFIAHI